MKGGVFSIDQVSQHSRLIVDLQAQNAHASHLLLQLGRMHLLDRRIAIVSKQLTYLTRTMKFQVFLCEQVIADRSKRFDVIHLIIGRTCDFCLETGKGNQIQNNEDTSKTPLANKSWAIQVERLAGLTISVAHKLFQTSYPPTFAVEHLLRSLGSFRKVLMRQRRHLDRISVQRPTEIKVIQDVRDACPDCGRQYEDEVTGE